MRKNIAKVLAGILALTMLSSLAACGKKDDKKPEATESVVSEVKENVTSTVEDVTSTVENVTEEPTVDESAQKQENYEKIFEDLSKMEMYSKNVTMTVTLNGTIAMDIAIDESGNSKTSMAFTLEGKEASFAMYTIGKDAYLELHSPEMTSEGKKQAAQDLYYKSKSTEEDTLDVSEEKAEIDKIKDFKKEDVKLVKYVGTENIDGVQCDVVEAVILVDPTDSSNTTEDASSSVEKVETTYNFYFTTDENKFFGMETTVEGSSLKATLPKDISIKVPNAKNFKEVDNEKFAEASMTATMLMLTAAMSAVEMPTEAPTE